MSRRWLGSRSAVILGLLLFALAGCQGKTPAGSTRPSDETGTFAALPVKLPRVATAEIITGAPIQAVGATPRLPMLSGDRVSVPVAGSGRWVLLNIGAASPSQPSSPVEWRLWDPQTGESRPLPGWSPGPESRDSVLDFDDNWLLLSKKDSPESHRVLLWRLSTGETRELAAGRLADFMSNPSLAHGRVVWAQVVQNPSSGQRREQIIVYDIGQDKQQTVFDQPLEARTPTLESVRIGGNRLAWAQSARSDSGPDKLVIHDLATGEVQTLEIQRSDFVTVDAISDDGRYLLWSQRGQGVLFAMDFKTGETFQYGRGQHVGQRGHHVTFMQADGSNGGLYDLNTREVRLLTKREGLLSIPVGVMGKWFVWLEAPTAEGESGFGAGTYYFLPLG